MGEGEGNVKGLLIAAVLWIVILAGLAVATKFLILPYFKKDLEDDTGSESRYKQELTIAADSFSGYCVLRSKTMRNDLKSQGIKMTIEDDAADYEARMKALRKGKIQMAVFTVDSFILNGVKLKEFPASIVMVIDETKGADAIVGYKKAVPDLQSLDHPNARIVMTPQSPSEFLARTVIAHFNLPNLPENWNMDADGAGDVYKKFKVADKNKKHAYVLWEPYVSMALDTPGAHLLLDSSKLKGYIVDVLVAERSFLRDNPDLVKAVIQAYLRAAYSYSNSSGGLEALVVEDAKSMETEPISGSQAEKLVQGIEWKNTMENYAYFGLISDQESQGMQHIEDVIDNIADVLVKTEAVPLDVVDFEAHNLFYNGTLKELQAEAFHPGKKVSIIEGMGLGTGDLDQMRSVSALPRLSDAEWKKLLPVGQLRNKPIAFGRGTARINIQSQRELEDLARKLDAWPQYYLLVAGHARAEGDPEANLLLARERADSAADYLLGAGVNNNRIRVIAAPPSNKDGSAQSVTFEFKQPAY